MAQAPDVKARGAGVIDMGGDHGDGTADAGGVMVFHEFLGAEKIHSIFVGLHEQHFFHVKVLSPCWSDERPI